MARPFIREGSYQPTLSFSFAYVLYNIQLNSAVYRTPVEHLADHHAHSSRCGAGGHTGREPHHVALTITAALRKLTTDQSQHEL